MPERERQFEGVFVIVGGVLTYPGEEEGDPVMRLTIQGRKEGVGGKIVGGVLEGVEFGGEELLRIFGGGHGDDYFCWLQE